MHLHRHLAASSLHQANDRRASFFHRHEIDQGDTPVRRVEDGFENQGVVVVSTTDARPRVSGRDPPAPMFGRAEERCEQSAAIKARPAQPIYGAVTTDEGARRAIADQSVILDIQRKIGSDEWPATRRGAGLWSIGCDRRGTLTAIPGHNVIVAHLGSELKQNLWNDVFDGPTHVDEDWIFIGLRRFQDRELQVEEARQHGIFFAPRQPRSNQRPLAMQINDAHLRSATSQEIAVAALERWTCDHATHAELPPTVNPCRNLLQP